MMQLSGSGTNSIATSVIGTYTGKMRKIVLFAGIIYLILTFAALISQTVAIKEYQPIPQGTLDLSSIPYDDIGTFALQGTWEFYPEVLMRAQELKTIEHPAEAGGGYIEVPSQWHTYLGPEGKSLERTGFGTYVMHIKLPEPGYYALELKSIYSSYNLFIDDSLLLSAGTVGTSRSTTTPQFRPATATFHTQETDLQLILQIANFHHRKGGLVQDISFGTPQSITRSFIIENSVSVYLSGILFLMGIFLLSFYGKDNRDSSIFLFGLFCLIIAARSLLTNTIPILQVFPDFPYELEMKIEYLTISLGFLVFALYSHYAFGAIFNRRAAYSFAGLGGLYSLIILFSQVLFYNAFLDLFMGIISLYALYWMIVMTIGSLQRKNTSLIIIIGGAALGITVLNEILFYLIPAFSAFFTYNLIPFGLFFFVLAHSFEFSNRYIEALNISRELTNDLEKRITERTRELHEVNERLSRLASTDELTGLWNRNELQRRAEQEISRYERYAEDLSTAFSVLYIDLDNFKYYNDTFSHEIGDRVLSEFASVLKDFCRKADSAFRLGGDEFVMFLPKTDQHGAYRIAQRILESRVQLNRSICKQLQAATHTLIDIPPEHQITYSIGIATHQKGPLVIDSLIRLADESLLVAKANGKNRVIINEKISYTV